MPLVERVAVSEVYVTGVGRISRMGSCARIVLTVRDEFDITEQEVAARLIIPMEAIPDVILALAGVMERGRRQEAHVDLN